MNSPYLCDANYSDYSTKRYTSLDDMQIFPTFASMQNYINEISSDRVKKLYPNLDALNNRNMSILNSNKFNTINLYEEVINDYDLTGSQSISDKIQEYLDGMNALKDELLDLYMEADDELLYNRCKDLTYKQIEVICALSKEQEMSSGSEHKFRIHLHQCFQSHTLHYMIDNTIKNNTVSDSTKSSIDFTKINFVV